MNPAHHSRRLVIVILALIALALKVAIAYNTIGTNDAVFFYGFAKVLSQHSLQWTYEHSRYFNHPPLTAYYLRGIFTLTEQAWCQNLGVHFPFLLRLPGIIADFVVVLVLIKISDSHVRIPTWALALFTLSPVSLMVSGFHGNTDPVMVLFVVCAVWMLLRNRPALCGLFFAVSCQVKIIPILLLPILLSAWQSRRAVTRFTTSLLLVTLSLSVEPLVAFPAVFVRNVLAYGSYWGVWGITYCLRLTGLPQFNGTGAFDLPFLPMMTAVILKLVIVAIVCVLAWRRRSLGRDAAVITIAYAWVTFFVLSPGICAQYMVWLSPFLLLASPGFYGCCFLIVSSAFLFVFYNTTAGGLPWRVAISGPRAMHVWAPWSLLPWLALVVGAILLWRKNVQCRGTAPALALHAASSDLVQQ